MSDDSKFNQAMVEIYHRAKSEADYTASIFFNMIDEKGGLATAKHLINASKPSDGYTALWERQRLDLTVEALVIENSKWHHLFDDAELERAKKRLDAYGYNLAN